MRDIPIHKEVQQVVERLRQTSTDGYLISGLSDNNQIKDRAGVLVPSTGAFKSSLGFPKKEKTFHSFRSTLATRFQSSGVDELFAARIIGHAAGNMTYGLYAGDIDWDKAVAVMSKVDYQRHLHG